MEQKIIQGNCLEVMRSFADNSVDLVVSSPPYNVGIEYAEDFDDTKEWGEYERLMREVCTELYRIVRSGGRVCWNIPSFSSRQNLYGTFSRLFAEVGFRQYAEVIWNKKQISGRTAWGSFKSASQPNILPSHEYILVFYKGEKNHGKGEDDIDSENFIKWTDGMWTFPPETNSTHPAPFPMELPNRCIQMFSFIGETVLDPFAGNGTTVRAAKNLKRNGIGIELNAEYADFARKRLEQDTLL